MKISRMSAAACVFSLFSATAVIADDCSGRDHTAGTVLGAAGGAAIGGVATHNAGGAIAGAVVGGVAGNAIARSQDCNRDNYRDTDSNSRRGDNGGYDRRGDRGPAVSYYGRGYEVAPDENDYWGVESYDDFSADYRHIWASINRAQERGSLAPYEARRFSQRLQQIQYRADAQQRRGRFNPQDIEYQLSQLRDDMRSARRENREGENSENYNRR
jgi:hypothetical protein